MASTTTKAITARKKAAQDCVKKLDAAATSLKDFLAACRDCNDGSGDEQRGIADGRTLLIRDIKEYASWLDSRYNPSSN